MSGKNNKTHNSISLGNLNKFLESSKLIKYVYVILVIQDGVVVQTEKSGD